MNPETNRFEPLTEDVKEHNRKVEEMFKLIRPDGSPVSKHWSVFQEGEDIVIKSYTFKVKAIGETYILFEPVGIPIVGEDR